MNAAEASWPVYFVARAIRGRVRSLAKGQLFPQQSKDNIRGWGVAAGVPDAFSVPFAELIEGKRAFVRVLNAGSADVEKKIRELGLDYTAAAALVAGEVATHA